MKIVLLLVFFSSAVFSQELEIKWDKAASGLDFPEGPAWNGNGILYASNAHSNWIVKIENELVDTFVSAPTSPFNMEKTNGLTVFKDGSVYACEWGKGTILKFSPEGKCELISEGYEGKRFNRPNDLAFDPEGNLFFTDPNSYDSSKLDGSVYSINSETKELKQVYKGLGFPNGIAFSSDAKYLFVCESALHRILKFVINKDKTLGPPSVFAELPGGDPDGIAFDASGNLYAAHFGGQAVYVFNSDGKLLRKLITPGKKPSNVEFAGTDMKILYITEDETNAIYKTNVEIPGVKLFCSPLNQ